MDLKITPSGQTIVKPAALGLGANTDSKLLIYGLFQKGRVLAQDAQAASQRERSATSNSAARFVVYGKRTLTCMACARSGVSCAVRAATWLDARWPV